MKDHHGNQSINTKQHNKRQHSCCSQSPIETTNLQIDPCESPNETLISNKNNNKEQEAKIRSDSCQKAAWFMMGVGFLFPYNSVVTAIDFFAAIYFPSIDFALGWLLLAPSLLILCITLKFGYWGSIYHRVIVTLLLSSILTIAIPLLRNPYILFPCVFALGCLTAVLQGTLFSLLGFLGSDLMSITQTGIGCSGVMVGMVRVMTKYFEPDQLALSTYLYFGIAFVMVMIDIAVYVMVLHPSKRVQDAVHLDTLKNEALHGNLHEMKRTLSRTFSRSPSKRNSPKRSTPRRVMQNTHCHESSSMLDDGRKRDRYKSVLLSQLSVDSGEYKGSISPRRVMKETHSVSMSLSALFCASWKCQIAVLLNYSLTLSLFPGVMSLMVWNDLNDGWFAVIQILVFNLLDTVESIPFLSLGNSAVIYPFLLAFIPLFVLCVKPLVFPWKLAVVINAAMGFTNGLVGTSGFCLGPISPKVPEHEKGRTAQMLAVSLTGGLVVGSSSAFLIHYAMDYLL